MVPLGCVQLHAFQSQAKPSLWQRSSASPSAIDKPSHTAKAEKTVQAMKVFLPKLNPGLADG